MLVNLIDINQKGKFCKKIIFNICKCITNSSLIVNGKRVGAGLQNYHHSGHKTTQLMAQ